MAGKKPIKPLEDNEGLISEDGVLSSEMKQLMSPKALTELKTLSPTLQQFLLRWQDKRDLILGDQLKAELKEFLLDVYEKDNETVCKSVADIVSRQLAEVLIPIVEKLEILTNAINDVAQDVADIKTDISSIKTNINLIENRIKLDEEKIELVERRIEVKKKMLDDLRKDVDRLEPKLIAQLITEVNDLRPIIKRLAKTTSWKNYAIHIAIAVVISVIIMILFVV